VHKQTVAVCIRVPGPAGDREQHVRTFGTMTADLLTLRDWLTAHGVTHVALESTGVHWKPVYDVLEDAFRCLLVNAAHMHNVPGSFVPPTPIRELRDLTRYRKVLIQEGTREAQRLHKVLEDAGIKLASVATDILGVSGRAMLEVLVQGTTDPEVLAELARGRLRAKLPVLQQVLTGQFRRHHAFLLSELLAHLDDLEEAVDRLSARIARSSSSRSPRWLPFK
jgi:transposase